MKEIWEEKFQQIGLMWSFEPAESAMYARDLFAQHELQHILIPGVGYGRNAKVFTESGMNVTGIEISETAIRLARENHLDFPIYHGSVLRMPFDKVQYDGIFCYALLHLFNQTDRRQLLAKCFSQLRVGGIMVFSVVSKNYKMYGNGKPVSIDRFKIPKGPTVFYYDAVSVEKEFAPYGLVEYSEIDEPVRHVENEEPMKFFRIVCRKK